jgi:hypothetical protein
MRENRTYGSEGRESAKPDFLTPISRECSVGSFMKLASHFVFSTNVASHQLETKFASDCASPLNIDLNINTESRLKTALC